MRHTFFGGVHPAVHKENSRRKPIAPMDRQPKLLVLPLEMSREGVAEPLVKPGDRVRVGQPVAAVPGGTVTHCGISGRVTAIEDRPHPWGGNRPAIIIENDFQSREPDSPILLPLAPNMVSLEVLLQRTREAGVVGMGGGAWPTHQKLERHAGRVDTLIVNAVECEPYVTADYRLMLERSNWIFQGALTIARCLGCKRAVMVTAGDKIKAVETIERRLRKRSGVELLVVRDRYPLGAERQIIQIVTGREVPAQADTLDSGCIVLNVATVFAIQEALSGNPLTHRVVTVSGGAVNRPRNLRVPIGTPLRELVEEADGLRGEADLTLTGGPMMGRQQPDLDAPVTKDVTSLLCMTARETRHEYEAGICIRCGKCVASCPMHLTPTLVTRALRRKEYDRLPALHVEDCMACGSCSFTCPAGIPLKERMRQAKEIIKKGGVQE